MKRSIFFYLCFVMFHSNIQAGIPDFAVKLFFDKVFASVAHECKDGIVVSNQEGEVLFYNAGAEKILGYNSKEIVGARFYEAPFICSTIKAVLKKEFMYWQDDKEHEGVVKEVSLVAKSGKLIPVELSVFFPVIAGTRYIISRFLDLSKYKKVLAATSCAKDALQKVLGKVVSPQVAEQLLCQDLDTLQTGKRIQATVLFCDICKFTTISEELSPEKVVDLLNCYFSDVVAICEKKGGIVDKFVGDGALVVYGLEGAWCKKNSCSRAEQAVRSAFEIIKQTRKITLENGEPLLSGIGIHTGEVVAGPIGASERYQYTVIGDTVNIADRLEGLSKDLKYDIIISKHVFEQLSVQIQSRFDNLGMHELKGRNKTVHIFGTKC